MTEALLQSMSLEEKVGQLCVPILQSGEITPEIERAITKIGVGMIRFCPDAEFDNASKIVGKPNRYRTPSEMAAFTNEMQALAKKTPHQIPLLIAVDQEGGTRSDVNRAGAAVYASHMCFGVANDPDLTYRVAKATAEEFAAMGINLVQAPILDVFRRPGYKTMKAATFGEDVTLVTKHAAAMQRGFRDGGILAMVKHFPGYGSIATDAHKGVAEITKPLELLECEDVAPLVSLMQDDGVDAVMAGHAIVKCLDAEYPATLSKAVINDYLRGKLGFDGVVETDAMRMRAIQDRFGTAAASVMAINAGCDLVLLRGNEAHFMEGYEAILNAAKTGEISEKTLDDAVRRVLTLKEKAGLFKSAVTDPNQADKVVGCPAHREALKELARRSVSVVKREDLPLDKNNDAKILVVAPEPQKIAAATDPIQSVDMLVRAIKAHHENTEGYIPDLEPTDEQIQTAVNLAKNADIIVFASCNAILYESQVTLAEKLSGIGKLLVVVAMESPLDCIHMPFVKNYICTYGVANDWAVEAAACLFGKSAGNAVAPIALS